MKFKILIIFTFFLQCTTTEKIKEERPKEKEPVKEDISIPKPAEAIPLGLKPFKDYLKPQLDPFKPAFERIGIEYIKPERDKDGNRIVKFDYRGFKVMFKNWKGDYYITEEYRFKNKMFGTNCNPNQRFVTAVGNLKNDSIISIEYYIDFKSENNDKRIYHYCSRKTSDMIKEAYYAKSPVYDFDGNIIEPVPPQFTEKCKYFAVIPYLPLGTYLAKYDKVRVRENPSIKGKIVRELNKNDVVELIEDMGKIEEIGEDVAPWGKVKLADGTEGYIYGALLKQEGEFWP